MTVGASESHSSRRRGLRQDSLLSDATLSTVGAVGGTLLSGFGSILIARGLGVTSRGRWAVISSLAILVGTIAATGLPAASAYAVAGLRGHERKRFVRAALTAMLFFGALATVAYLIAAAVIRPPASTPAVVLGCAIPFASVSYSVTHRLNLTAGSMRWFAAAQLVNAAASLAVIVALYVLGILTVLAVVAVSAAGAGLGLAISLVALVRVGVVEGPQIMLAPAQSFRILRPYVAYALMTFAVLSLTTVVQRVDVLLVNGYRGPHAAGLYSVAGQLSDLLLVVPGAFGLAIFRRGARSTPGHYQHTLTLLRWTLAFALVAAVVSFLLAPWAVPLALGSGYSGSVTPLRLLLVGVIAFSLQSVLSQYLASRGRPRVVFVAWSLGAIVGIGADLAVIPRWGIDGAAVVSSVSYILVMALHLYALRQLVKGDTAGGSE